MKILLLGATGQTGSIVLEQALEHGHDVTAFVRNPGKISVQHKNLTIVKGEVLSLTSLTNAMKGQDAVMSCLGGDDNNKSTILTDMTDIIVKAMTLNDIKRITSIATAGVHNEFSLFTNIIVKLIYKNVINDHKGAVHHIMNADLNYTIARPLSLTDGERSKFRTVVPGVPKGGKELSRKDLADFLIDVIEHDKFIKQSVGLAY
jgi:putative NADH-flavin reductase